MQSQKKNSRALREENAELQARLEEAEETLRAIRNGEVDALVVGEQVYTLTSAEAASNRFRGDVLNQVNDAVVALNNEQRLIYLNPAAERQYGVDASEVVGCNVAEIFQQRWVLGREAERTKLLHENGKWRGELVHVKHSGEEIHVEATGSLLRDSEGAVVGELLVIRDITERKHAEARERRAAAEALAAAETNAKFRTLFEQGSFFAGIMNLDGTLVEANRISLEANGFTVAETIGKKFWDCGWWNRSMELMAMIRLGTREAAAGKTFRRESPYFAADGSKRFVDLIIAPATDESGKVLFLVPTGTDITARKQAEDALRESEERFRTMADNMAPLAWMAEPDGHIFFYNQRWFNFTGTTLEEMRGWGWKKVHHPEHVDRVVEKWRDHLQRGEGWEDTFPLRGTDGKYRWFLSRAIPVHDSTGNILRWFGTNMDITELRETQNELQKAQEQLTNQAAHLDQLVQARTAELTAANEQLETFVYSIAHDLRGPLRSMEGFSTLLLDEAGSNLNDTCQSYAHRINKSAQFMDALLADLLAFSSINQDQMELVSVNLEDVIQNVMSRLEREISETQAQIEITGPWPQVLAHAPTVGQVLFNLINNALKFVSPPTPPRIRVWAEERGEFIRVWVEDNGIGIAAEHHEQVFRIFNRLHGELYPGTGIGLAIVQKGIERMLGRVGLESTPGKGSRFWFELQKP